MKLVVSLQREPEDDEMTPAWVKRQSKAMIRRCLELLEEHPHMEWMTQTEQLPRRKKR